MMNMATELYAKPAFLMFFITFY